MVNNAVAIIDGMTVQIEGEKNLLELIRKANIDLPTFCYHPELSVYGSCRMCIVDVEGRGVLPACSTPISPGMVIKTNTKQIRGMRKTIVELMLASHCQNCTTCPKSGECKLQTVAKQLGVTKVRFKQVSQELPIDDSSYSVVRDPGKCILCGDCVRTCKEIQTVGALDFVNRGADSQVMPCFNKPLSKVECVNCGQCVKVCPVGALTVKSNIDDVFSAIHDAEKTVVVQIAPAVRVALGEVFGGQPGELATGKMVSALRRMGFNKVYDTSFAADLTVVEEGNEFLARFTKNENIPQFTSCCPAWVKFAEQYYQDYLPNLSSCRSPQQMFGSMCKEVLTKEMNIPREKLVVVSIMPCTAKKFEANRDEFKVEGNNDVDFVLTTKELSQMIKESGIQFDKLEADDFDMPFGAYTGAGVIFGTSGGVSEAVLRYAASTLNAGGPVAEFKELRHPDGTKVLEIAFGGKTLRLAVVSGLANARALMEKIKSGEGKYDLVEVMACCGGCVNGGGQPEHEHKADITERAKGLYEEDTMQQFRNSSDNPYLQKLYKEDVNEDKAHHLFHTTYEKRSRIVKDEE